MYSKIQSVHYLLTNRCPLTGLIATACADDSVRIFAENTTPSVAGGGGGGDDVSAPSFELRQTLHAAHSQDVNCVAWNPRRAGLLASCSDDGDVKLWQVDVDQL